jgi:hypothetical protein
VNANAALAEGTVVAEGASVAGDAAEHADRAAPMHRAVVKMIDSLADIWWGRRMA